MLLGINTPLTHFPFTLENNRNFEKTFKLS